MTKIRIIHIVILVSIVCSWMWSALKEWHKDFNKSLQKFPEELKTFKASLYSSEKHFLFDNYGFGVCEIKVFLWNLAIVSDGN